MPGLVGRVFCVILSPSLVILSPSLVILSEAKNLLNPRWAIGRRNLFFGTGPEKPNSFGHRNANAQNQLDQHVLKVMHDSDFGFLRQS